MSDREQFEAAWAKEYPLHGRTTFTRSGFEPERYANTRTQDGWLMWQAARMSVGVTKAPAKLRRPIDTWRMCGPNAMARMSEAAISYAFDDLLHDVLVLAEQHPSLAEKRSHELPSELTPPVRHVLSLMLWQTLPIANALRATGRHINRKTEDEQAAALHWLLGIALEHGEKWEQAAARALHQLLSEKKGV